MRRLTSLTGQTPGQACLARPLWALGCDGTALRPVQGVGQQACAALTLKWRVATANMTLGARVRRRNDTQTKSG